MVCIKYIAHIDIIGLKNIARNLRERFFNLPTDLLDKRIDFHRF
jgi:hypothetical protein